MRKGHLHHEIMAKRREGVMTKAISPNQKTLFLLAEPLVSRVAALRFV